MKVSKLVEKNPDNWKVVLDTLNGWGVQEKYSGQLGPPLALYVGEEETKKIISIIEDAHSANLKENND